MTILLNARFVTQPMTGVQRVAYEMTRRVAADRRLRIRAVAPVAPPLGFALPAYRLQPFRFELHGHAWEQAALRSVAVGAALTIGLGNTGPVGTRARQLLMIHDVNYLDGPAAYSRRFRRAYRLMHGWHSRRSALCTVSAYSAERIAHHFGIERRRIAVLPASGEHLLEVPPDPTVIARHGLGERPFLLLVGSANPNKNVGAAVDAYARLGSQQVDLAIVGGRADRVFRGAAPVGGAGIKPLGPVTDCELRALYENAAAFLFPSRLEGFGIPALEAMTLGCPVVASDRASLPEVCGDAALYCDASDPDAIAAAMRRLLGDADLRAELVERGRARAARFRWRNSADGLADLIRRTL